MKTKILFISLLLLFITDVNGQSHDFECGTTAEMMLRSATAGSYSANGYPFTPKGDLRVLIICAGFGPNYDNQFIHNWPSHPDSLPTCLTDGSTFYSSYSQFTSNPPASAIKNVSAYYYAMSRGTFRIIANVYPKRINITSGGTWGAAAKKVIQQMKTESPSFNWSTYDNRTNSPNYLSDNRNTSSDSIPDYVIIIYRYNKAWANLPLVNPGHDAVAKIDLDATDIYNGYTFDKNCGYTQKSGGSSIFMLFIHEVAHTLYHAPHVSGANRVIGNYFFTETGWSQMSQDYMPFVSSNAWERWYLDWIDGIKANGVNADIQSASNLNSTGEYTLRDFITTGDAMRIKIPNGSGVNQYLWLENHQGKSIYDNQLILKDECNNNFPTSPRGIVAYIESINDNKNNPGNTVYSGANGLKFLHAAGNFDYTYQSPPATNCWYGNDVYNFHRAAINPISGQSGAQEIKSDFNNNNVIDICTNSNSHSDCTPNVQGKADNKANIKRDGAFVYDILNGDRAFAAGRKLSMASNPCLINRPQYQSNGDKMGTCYLNGISVSILSYDASGNAKVKVRFKDVDIANDTRYTGFIHLPDITGDTNPDINILSGCTLRIDKSGTPNKVVKTTVGDFINLTTFNCLSNSYFKQSAGSKVFVENGSSLIIESGAKYEVNGTAELAIKSGSNLTVKSGGILTLKNSALFSVELGATFIVEPGAIVN